MPSKKSRGGGAGWGGSATVHVYVSGSHLHWGEVTVKCAQPTLLAPIAGWMRGIQVVRCPRVCPGPSHVCPPAKELRKSFSLALLGQIR